MKRLAALLLVIACASCNSTRSGGIYRTPVQQGNIITPSMVSQLEIDMTKAQAAFILGMPILKTFHDDNRWDYVYRLQLPLQEPVARKLTLYFEDDKLTSFTTDVVVPKEEQEPVADENAEDDGPPQSFETPN